MCRHAVVHKTRWRYDISGSGLGRVYVHNYRTFSRPLPDWWHYLKWQNKWKMEQVNKKSGNMSKGPGLGGSLGGLCNILFPKKCSEKYMYEIFPYRMGC